jgi:16S rRNA (guanine966-N2)-methyltransferase
MTRIIAGLAGGRRLQVPPKGTRPTSDRVREALFSSLDSELLTSDLSWESMHVLDLYAGSGALGLEARSRGAASVVLVEKSAPAAAIIRANIASVALDNVSVIVRDVSHLSVPSIAATVVFADPPYDMATQQIREVLAHLKENGWIAHGAIVVVERSGRDDNPLPDTWTLDRRRPYGETVLWYGRPVG